MLLSEGQMSDYKGAALLLNALPPAKTMLADRGYDADWFRHAWHERGIVPASRQRPTANYRSRTIAYSTGNATKSKTCSAGSKIGDESTPVTTAAPTPSSPQSASPQSSSSGSINES